MLDRSTNVQQILRIISDSDIPLNSKMISSKTSMWQSNVIRILDELIEKGAIENVTSGKRSRMFIATEKGKSTLKMIDKLQS